MKKRNTRSIVLFVFILATLSFVSITCRLSANAGAGSDTADLLPRDNDISGFTKKGTTALMSDEQSIFDAIDGAAGKYIEYGFIDGVEQMYSNGSINIDIRIFNQGNKSNAQALYQEFFPTSPEILSTADPSVVIDHSLISGYTIYFAQQNIYMEVVAYEKSIFALNMARQFYQSINLKISSR